MQPKDTENSEQPKGPKDSHITPEAFERRQPVYDPTGRIEHINHDEIRVADIRQHPIGLIIQYLQISLGLVLGLGLIVFLMPGLLDTFNMSGATANAIVGLFALIAVSVGLAMMVLVTRVYNSHQLIATDKNITQVLQIGLFNRQVSELGMGNVEDVTAQQKGILPTLFNYGQLRIETAGEQNNFVFNYCPNPNAYAKAILDARAHFLDGHETSHDNV